MIRDLYCEAEPDVSEISEALTNILGGFFRAELVTPMTPKPVSPTPTTASPQPPSPFLDSPYLTLAEAASRVGLTERSLAKRIIASGGKRIYAQCGRLPGKLPLFERDKFFAWYASPANISPARTKADERKRRRRR